MFLKITAKFAHIIIYNIYVLFEFLTYGPLQIDFPDLVQH